MAKDSGFGHKRFGDMVVCDRCGVFEIIPHEELKTIANIIIGLQDKQIDDLFFNCGLVYESDSDRQGLRALTPELLKDIKRHKEKSDAFLTLQDEHSKQEIMKGLEIIITSRELKETK